MHGGAYKVRYADTTCFVMFLILPDAGDRDEHPASLGAIRPCKTPVYAAWAQDLAT